MTVGELRKVLLCPNNQGSIVVMYHSDEYDITLPSPTQDAFDRYLVDRVLSLEPYKYSIALKEAFMTEDGYEEDRDCYH